MISRILPPDEWHRLSITQFEQIGPTMRPEDVQIVVVEDGERIVATMAVLRVTHFESLWIDPEYRGNAGLGRRLVKAAVQAAKTWTDKWVWGTSESGHMDDITRRLGGVQVPVQTFMIPLGGN
jgi:GNAT superfamily N-acetyltransferase